MRLNSMWAPLGPILPKRDPVRSAAARAIWARRTEAERIAHGQAASKHRAGWTAEQWSSLGRKGREAMNRKSHAERSAIAVASADDIYRRKLEGEQCGPQGKLTPDQVLEIKLRYRRTSYHGSNSAVLAAEYGVTKSLICQIVRGAVWRRAKP